MTEKKIINLAPTQGVYKNYSTLLPQQHFTQNFGENEAPNQQTIGRYNTNTNVHRSLSAKERAFEMTPKPDNRNADMLFRDQSRERMSAINQNTDRMERISQVNLEDSIAHPARPPKYIEHLTEWLRREYFRKNGVYCNGSTGEFKLLSDLWKFHISEKNKHEQELKRKEQREQQALDKLKAMEELEKKDPAAARRKKLEAEKKAEKKREAEERAQKIMDKSMGAKSTLKRPQSGAATRPKTGHTWVPPGMQTIGTAKGNEGGAVAAAVPSGQMSENNPYFYYEKFKKEFELDVNHTIEKDLNDERLDQATKNNTALQANERAMKAEQRRREKAIVDSMIDLYFYDQAWTIEKKKLKEEKKKLKEEEKKNSSVKKDQPGGPAPQKDAKSPDTQSKSASPDKKTGQGSSKTGEADALPSLAALFEKYPEQGLASRVLKRVAQLVREKLDGEMPYNPDTFAETYNENVHNLGQDPGSRANQTKIEQVVRDFFAPASFFRRLTLHKAQICKSKTKKEQPDTLYWISLNAHDKTLNFLHPKDALAGLQERDAEKKKAHAEAQAKLESESQVSERTKYDKDRLKQLAKPKDKWKVGKELMALQRQFPHDRVLQRMVKEEFKENQVFRYPEEYDVFRNADEQPKKLASGARGLQKQDFSAGEAKLEGFKKTDATLQRQEKEKKYLSRRAELKLEKALIHEAEEYLPRTKKIEDRPVDGHHTVRPRPTLIQIYLKFSNDPDLKEVLDRKYPVYIPTKRETLEPEKQKEDQKNLEEGEKKVKKGDKKQQIIQDSFNEEVYKREKIVPDSFKREFLRLLRILSSKKSGRMTITEVKKGSRRLPTTFMVAGLANSHNKKILLTNKLAQARAKIPPATRTRAFYREDTMDHRKQVFMTLDDQINCRFEPVSGSLNPYHKETQQEKENAQNPIQFHDRLGKNIEISKKGVLKMAQRLYDEGKYQEAFNKISGKFNIESIKIRKEPTKQIASKLLKQGLAKMFQKKPSEDQGVATLDQMREADTQEQDKLGPEDWENKKMVPILEEVYVLLKKIEGKKLEADKQVKKLQQTKVELKKKYKELQQFSENIEEQVQKSHLIFKTIMCPYGDKCPKDKRARWPKADRSNVKQFGEKCLYAHHPNELQFKETLRIQVQSITQTQKKLKSEAEGTKPKPFMHTGPIDPRKQKPLPEPKVQKKMNESMKKQREKYEDHSVTRYINQMREIGEELMQAEEGEDGEVKEKKKVDDNYYVKFGHLKKAAVLKYYGRNNDAYDCIVKAAKIVVKQREINKKRDEAIQERWKFKLGLGDFELPDGILKYHPKDPRMEEQLRKNDLGGIPLATVRLYIEKVSPFNLDAFSRDVYLDRCIEEMMLECEAERHDKKISADKMKTQIEKLEGQQELVETYGEDNLADQVDDDGEPIKFKPRKTKMCEHVVEPRAKPYSPNRDEKPEGYWKRDKNKSVNFDNPNHDRLMGIKNEKLAEQEREKVLQERQKELKEGDSVLVTAFPRKKHFSCPREDAHKRGGKNNKKHPPCHLAHNPLQLELTPINKKIENLKSVQKILNKELKPGTPTKRSESAGASTMRPWVPANAKREDDIACFQPYIEEMDPKRKIQEDDGGEEKPKSVFERETLYKNIA